MKKDESEKTLSARDFLFDMTSIKANERKQSGTFKRKHFCITNEVEDEMIRYVDSKSSMLYSESEIKRLKAQRPLFNKADKFLRKYRLPADLVICLEKDFIKIRKETVEECAKIADEYEKAAMGEDFMVSKASNSRCIAQAIRKMNEL